MLLLDGWDEKVRSRFFGARRDQTSAKNQLPKEARRGRLQEYARRYGVWTP